jgi:hypothetical protein
VRGWSGLRFAEEVAERGWGGVSHFDVMLSKDSLDGFGKGRVVG